MRDFYSIIKLTVNFLNKNNIPYMVVGAVSVAIWGSPRTSQDIDFLIILKEENIKKFLEFCNKTGLSADEDEIKQALKEKSHVTIFDNESVYRLNIKGIYDELDKITFSRRKKVKFRNLNIWVNTPEDSILAKLVYGSPQDLNDAKSIFLRQKEGIDINYLKKQAKYFKVIDLLNSLF